MIHRLLLPLAFAAALAGMGCHDDEGQNNLPPPRGDLIGLTYANPAAMAVNSARHWALLLHDRSSPRGTALQLVDLDQHSVVATQVLDYYDAFDVIFLFGDEACFAGRTQDTRNYAIQFFSLPDLILGSRVVVADTSGVHGYLAADSAGQAVYYTQAGGGNHDAIYKISLTSKTIVDADDDGHAPFGFDNHLVANLLAHPARISVDASTHKLLVANLDDDYITMIDSSLWGTVHRGGLTFPIPGTSHLNTLYGGLTRARAEAMGGGGGIYVFAGGSGTSTFLSRFEATSVQPYPPETPPGITWLFRNADIWVHPDQSIFSAFVLQRDSSGVNVGKYGLNNLRSVRGSPYHMQVIPDSAIGAIGLDIILNKIVVADAREPRLELIAVH